MKYSLLILVVLGWLIFPPTARATNAEHFFLSMPVQAACEAFTSAMDHSWLQHVPDGNSQFERTQADTTLRVLTRHALCVVATVGVNAVYETMKPNHTAEWNRLLPAAGGAGVIFTITLPWDIQ